MRFRYQHNSQFLHSGILLKSLILCLFLSFTTFVNAKAIKGELEIKYWSNTEETIDIPIMKVRYNLDLFVGDPLEQFSLYYETPNKYTEVVNAKFRAQVSVGGITQDAYIKIDPLVDAPGKWGWDVAGSAEWDNMFQTRQGKPVSAEVAKSYFKNKLSLVNLEVLNIKAISGINDPEYENFLSLIPTSYTKPIGSKGLLAGKIPTRDREYSNFWNDRKIAENHNWRAPVNEHERSDIVSMQSITHLNWMYGQYQHAYVELEFQHLSDKSEESQEVIIDFFWKDYDTGKTRKKTYRRTVKKGKMALVAAERVHRPRRKDGSLSVYKISLTIRYTKQEESEEKKIAKDRLDNAFESEQIKLFTLEQYMNDSYKKRIKQVKEFLKTPEGKRELERQRLAKLEKEKAIQREKERLAEEKRLLEEEERLLAEEARLLAEETRLLELERFKQQREHEELLAKAALEKDELKRKQLNQIRNEKIKENRKNWIAKEKKRKADKKRYWANRRAIAKQLALEKERAWNKWNNEWNNYFAQQKSRRNNQVYYPSTGADSNGHTRPQWHSTAPCSNEGVTFHTEEAYLRNEAERDSTNCD